MSALLSSSPQTNMLKSQILTGNVLDEPVLEALLAVPREEFVPAAYQGVAYVDEEIPLCKGRSLLAPLSFARLLEMADTNKKETVLLIGCGTGYSAAILSRLAQQVVAIEEDAQLAAQAKQHLASYSNVVLKQAPLAAGEHSHAPYDVVMIEGAVEHIPQAIRDQVKEGGRLVTFERKSVAHVGTSGLTPLTQYTKIHGALHHTAASDASVAALSAFTQPATFAF